MTIQYLLTEWKTIKRITLRKIHITSSVFVFAIVATLLTNYLFIPLVKYNDAIKLREAGQFESAATKFENLGDFLDSPEQILDTKYAAAKALMDAEEYAKAIAVFGILNGYKDSKDKINECNIAILDEKYESAKVLMDNGQYEEARTVFQSIRSHRDSETQIIKCMNAIKDIKYNNAKALMDNGQYEEAISAFEQIRTYRASAELIAECKAKILDSKYNDAVALMNAGKYSEAISAFEALDGYKDSIAEAYKYFSTDSARQCRPTLYAFMSEAYVLEPSNLCWWWLRSPGYYQNYAAYVELDGSVSKYGFAVDFPDCAVRPAMWIHLNP